MGVEKLLILCENIDYMIDFKLKNKWDAPSQSLPIIFIGAGGIIRNAHIPAYNKLNLKISGVYDLNPETAKTLAKDFNISNVYSNLDDALNNKNVVFDIAVPADQLLPIVQKLPLNSYALLQKPMGSNIQEAEKILKVSRERNITAALNFQLRFSPMMLCLRDAIDKNLLGKIVDIEFHYSYYLPWHLWPFLEEIDRVEIPYNSIHLFDLIRSLFGMNNGRENMRKALGMNMDTPAKEAIQKFWLLGEFLELGAPKDNNITVDKDIKERQDKLDVYKATISTLKKKLEERAEEKKSTKGKS